jgi:hypothetical protein
MMTQSQMPILMKKRRKRKKMTMRKRMRTEKERSGKTPASSAKRRAKSCAVKHALK